MKKRIIIGVIAAVVIIGIVGLGISSKKNRSFTSVRTGNVTKGDISDYLSTTATIKAKNSKSYFAPQQSVVKSVNVKVGDRVKKGDVLVTYDAAGSESDENVADFDGVVTEVNAVVGSSQTGSMSSTTSSGASSGAAVTVDDQSNLQAEVNLDKYSATEVKVGQPVDVTFANKKYKGRVSFVAPSAQTVTSSTGQTTTLLADIDIDAPQTGLVEGFDADVDILVGKVNNVIKVPAESIKTDKYGNNYIFIVSNNKAVQKKVKLGLQSDTDAQVTSGVNSGNKVILNPSASLQNGMLVRDSRSTGGK